MNQLPPTNKEPNRFHLIVIVLSSLALVALYFLVQAVVNHFKNPNQMDIVRSMTMDMTVHMPAGSMPVETETLHAAPFQSIVTYTGSADAYNEVPIYPRVEGWIQSLPVYSGDRVTKGELVARLDSAELSSRVQEAQHGAEAARKTFYAALKSRDEAAAHKDHYKHQITETKADLDYWTREIERMRKLVQDQVVSQEEFDRELAQFKTAEAKYHQMIANADAARSAYEAAEFQVESAKDLLKKESAGLHTREIIRRYTNVTAPVNGVVMDRKFDIGILVKPDTEIMRIAQIDPIRIQVNVSMEDTKKITPGTPVTIWIDKLRTGEPVTAKITSLFATTDVATRTTKVEALVPNKNGRILPGDFITADIHIGKASTALSVPNSAIIERDQQKAVWIVKDGRADLRYVTTGGTDGKRTAVVSGLEEGDEVIAHGHRDLTAQDMVTPGKFDKDRLFELPKAGVSNRLDSANNYHLRRSLAHYVMTVQLSTKPPKTGLNNFDLEFTAMHGALPSDLTIEVQSQMPAMPSMPAPRPNVRKHSAGSFRVAAEFAMPGAWQIMVTTKEGQRTMATDEFLVEVAK